MNMSRLTAQQLLGLFELDGSGKVLYYRMDASEERGTSLDMTGYNFYDEVAPFKNVDEFRNCVTEFTYGAKPADSFDFDCHYEDSDHPVRVLLARIRQHMNQNITKSVLVHFRRGANTYNTTGGQGNERDVD